MPAINHVIRASALSAVMLSAGCYVAPNLDAELLVDNGKEQQVLWRLQKLGHWDVPANQQLSLRFRPDRYLQANGPCNFIFARYQTRGSRLIRHGDLKVTARACAKDQQILEDRYVDALSKTHSWEANGVMLTAKARDGAVVATYQKFTAKR